MRFRSWYNLCETPMFSLFDEHGADNARSDVIADREFKGSAEIEAFKAQRVNEHQALNRKTASD